MFQINLGSGFPLDKKFERHLKRYINCGEIRSLKKNFGVVPDFYKRQLERIRKKLSRKYPYWTEDLTFLVIISEILFHWNNYESFRSDLTIKQPYLWQGAGEILDAWKLAKRNPMNIESITIAVRGSRSYTLKGVAREGLSKVKKEKDPVLRKFNIKGATPIVFLTKSIEQNITELKGLAKWEQNLKSKRYNEVRGKKAETAIREKFSGTLYQYLLDWSKEGTSDYRIKVMGGSIFRSLGLMPAIDENKTWTQAKLEKFLASNFEHSLKTAQPKRKLRN